MSSNPQSLLFGLPQWLFHAPIRRGVFRIVYHKTFFHAFFRGGFSIAPFRRGLLPCSYSRKIFSMLSFTRSLHVLPFIAFFSCALSRGFFVHPYARTSAVSSFTRHFPVSFCCDFFRPLSQGASSVLSLAVVFFSHTFAGILLCIPPLGILPCALSPSFFRPLVLQWLFRNILFRSLFCRSFFRQFLRSGFFP